MERKTQALGRYKPETGRSESVPGQNAAAKLGAERKKIGILILLVVAAVGIYLRPSHSSEMPTGGSEASSASGSSIGHSPLDQQGGLASATGVVASRPAAPSRTAAVAFKPSIKRRPSDVVDLKGFDPTLRTDLLDRLADVPRKEARRNLFDFYKEPVPVLQAELPPPPPAVTTEPVAVVHLPPPPIPLRFYGHTLAVGGGDKRVFCIFNDQVMTPSEGAVLQRRYKIQKILTASVLVEDLEDHHEQTLPIDGPAQTQAR
ncbi:MAG: hypothetical protein WBW33_35330 [Bryobacteraceae bacterium]